MSLVKLLWKICPSALVKNISIKSKHRFYFRYFSNILSKILESCDNQKVIRVIKKILKMSKLGFH